MIKLNLRNAQKLSLALFSFWLVGCGSAIDPAAQRFNAVQDLNQVQQSFTAQDSRNTTTTSDRATSKKDSPRKPRARTGIGRLNSPVFARMKQCCIPNGKGSSCFYIEIDQSCPDTTDLVICAGPGKYVCYSSEGPICSTIPC